MKRTLLFWMCVVLSHWMAAQGFIHPGALHTQADFDRVKEKLAIGAEPWTSAYKKFKTSPHLDLNFRPNPTVKIIRDGNKPEEPEPSNYWVAYGNAHTAYQCALEWKITGDTRYADKAVEILNAWARVCKMCSGDPNVGLAVGIYGYQFANAGELMRDYEGWKREDFARYQDWMHKVFLEKAFAFLSGRVGKPGENHYWSNWGLCNMLCAVSIAILCDDVYYYNAAMEYYKYYEDHKLAESLHHLVWILFPDERGPFGYLGQMQESNRDQGHASMAVALAADICGVGTNQGEDLYMHMNDRIAAGFEYVAAYNMGVDDLPNEPYEYAHYICPEMGWGGRGTNRCNWPRIVNYYENVRGVEVPYCRAIMEAHENGTGIDGGGGFYGGASGGYDHLGFTSLMCSLDPLTDKTKVPTVLGGMVQYGDASTTRTEIVNIPRGTKVKMTVTLPEDETDTGKWSWDDDPSCTSNEHEITLETSRLYRVRYINSKGVECTRMYSLHVDGEGRVLPFVPYCKIDATESSDTIIYVKKGGKLKFGVNYPGFNVRQWVWEKSTDGQKWTSVKNGTNLFEIPSVNTASYYRVTMEHKSGITQSQIFRVEVAEIDPFIITNGKDVQGGTSTILPKGASFSLYAEPTSVLAKSVNTTRIYKWVVNNDTIRRDTLTYHLNGNGIKVADLNDTLHVAGLDTCFRCTLVFERISSTGSSAKTVYHFDIPVYETNTENPGSDDSYYIVDAATGMYLRNTDAQFVAYNEETEKDYLWRLRRLNSSYGSRYMLISRSNSSQHLSNECKMSMTSDYSKHSFNLLRKCTDEGLYAVQLSPTASAGFLIPTDDGMALTTESGSCTGFPFRIVKKVDNPDGVEDIMMPTAGEGESLLCGRDGSCLTVNVPEAGVLRVYGFNGQLLQAVRCHSGENTLQLPFAGCGWILRYVGESGCCQGAKIR